MNSAAFVLLILASGYIAARRSLIWRPHIFRSDGHALYFLVVATSLAVAAYSSLLLHELEQGPVLGTSIHEYLSRLLRAFGTDDAALPLGRNALASVPAAILLAWLLNIPLVSCRTIDTSTTRGEREWVRLEPFLSGRRVRTFDVIADFSREALAVEIDPNLHSSRVIRTLDRVAA